MSKAVYKILAYLFGVFAIGGIFETKRIITSPRSDIASQSTYLTIMALVVTVFAIGVAIACWNKAKN